MSTTQPTAGNDTLVGLQDAPDTISALDGDDVVDGRGAGANGTDQIFGDAGADTLIAGASGFAALDGGPDGDLLDGQLAASGTLIGAGGDDTLFGFSGYGVLHGDVNGATVPGADLVQGGDGSELIFGGPGDDTLSSGNPGTVLDADEVDGGDGQDVLALPGGPGDYGADTFPGYGAWARIEATATSGPATGIVVDVREVEQIAFGVTAAELAAGVAPLTLFSMEDFFAGSSAINGRKHWSLSDTVAGATGATRVAIDLGTLLANDLDPDGDALTLVSLLPDFVSGAGSASIQVLLSSTDIAAAGYPPGQYRDGLVLVDLDAPLAAPVRFTYRTEMDVNGAGIETGSTATVTILPGGTPAPTDDSIYGNYGGETFIPYAALLANDGPGAVWGGLSNPIISYGGSIVDDPLRGGIVIQSPVFFGSQAYFEYSLAGVPDTAFVEVQLFNGPPVAVPIARVVSPGSAFTLDFADIAGHLGSFDPNLTSSAANSIVAIAGAGLPTASYTLSDTAIELSFAASYAGDLTLSYTLTDSLGAISPPGTISFLLTAPPGPVANADTLRWGLGDGRSIFEGSRPGHGVIRPRDLLANDTGMPGTVMVPTVPQDLTPADASQLVRTYEAAFPRGPGLAWRSEFGSGFEFKTGFTGTDTFTYYIVDPLGRVAQGTLAITVDVPQPVLRDNVVLIPAGATSVTITAAQILGNDSFTGAGAIAEVLGNVLISIDDSGVDVGGGYTGIESFTFALDPSRALSTYQFNILTFDTAAAGGSANGVQRVTLAQAGPLSAGDDGPLAATIGVPGLITGNRLLANDSGSGIRIVGLVDDRGTPDTADDLIVTSVATAHGTRVALRTGAPGDLSATDGSTAVVDLAPIGSVPGDGDPYRGPDSFTYVLEDVAGNQARATVGLNFTNERPIARDDAFTLEPGTPSLVIPIASLLANDSDVDAGQVISLSGFVVQNAAGGGTLVRVATAPGTPTTELIYTPADPAWIGTETFRYFITDGSDPAGTLSGGASALISFTVGDPPPMFSISAVNASVVEGTAPGTGGILQFVISRTGDLLVQTRVDVAIGPGTANGASADDVDGPFRNVSFSLAAGAAQTVISVPAIPDDIDEPDETVTLTLTGTSFGTIGTPSSATVTIIDDDEPLPVFSVAAVSASVMEGSYPGPGGTLQFVITRTGDLTRPATISYAAGPGATNGASADDINGPFPSRSITLQAGVAQEIISFDAVPDNIDEPDETVTFTLTGAIGGTIGTASSATVTIIDDDEPPPVFSVAAVNSTVIEGTAPGPGGILQFVITRTGDLFTPAIISFVTSPGPMNGASTDDIGGPFPFNTFNVLPGVAQTILSFSAVADNIDEPDKTFTLTLTGVSGGSIAAPSSATITILDDDLGSPPTRGDDSIIGTPLPDALDGLRGNDTMLGLGDADTLIGAPGADSLGGEGGNDVLEGGVGDDALDGGEDDDVLIGGAGEDVLAGGGGADAVYGSAGADWINGDAGDDLLLGQGGDDTLRGGLGNDTLRGGADSNRLEGGEGDDLLFVGERGDLFGGTGGDTLTGGDGADRMLGGAGIDLLRGGDGADSLEGGEGADSLLGDAGADTLRGGAGADSLDGGGGGDCLFGDASDDSLDGGSGFGNDTLTGGNGADTLGGRSDSGTFGGFVSDAGGAIIGATFTAGDLVDLRLASGARDGAADTVLYGVSLNAFGFPVHDGVDRILGFEAGMDRLLIPGGSGAGPVATPTLTEAGGSTYVTFTASAGPLAGAAVVIEGTTGLGARLVVGSWDWIIT